MWEKVLVNTYVNGRPYFFSPVNNGGAWFEINMFKIENVFKMYLNSLS